MTLSEVARTYKRICGKYSNDNCNDCPLTERKFIDADGCLNAMIQFPDEFEKVLLDWVKENPVPTNRDKFFEVFLDRNYSDEDCTATCDTVPCAYCDWWDEEYVEPDKEDEQMR